MLSLQFFNTHKINTNCPITNHLIFILDLSEFSVQEKHCILKPRRKLILHWNGLWMEWNWRNSFIPLREIRDQNLWILLLSLLLRAFQFKSKRRARGLWKFSASKCLSNPLEEQTAHPGAIIGRANNEWHSEFMLFALW